MGGHVGRLFHSRLSSIPKRPATAPAIPTPSDPTNAALSDCVADAAAPDDDGLESELLVSLPVVPTTEPLSLPPVSSTFPAVMVTATMKLSMSVDPNVPPDAVLLVITVASPVVNGLSAPGAVMKPCGPTNVCSHSALVTDGEPKSVQSGITVRLPPGPV